MSQSDPAVNGKGAGRRSAESSKTNAWFRLWHEMPTDPKFRVIAKRSGRPLTEVLSLFVLMMTNASANATERGRTSANWSDEDAAAALDMEPDHVTAIRKAMIGKVLDETGLLLGWKNRQSKREDGSAERAKAWRERNRTQPNAANALDREIDREEKKEEPTSNEVGVEFAVANVDPPPDEVSKGTTDLAGEPIPRDDRRLRSEAMPVQQAWEAYQRMALPAGLPIPRMLTPALRSSIGARLRESAKTSEERLAVWDEMLAKVAASSFLRGRNDRSFRADLHWLVKPANYAKALAGNYDDRPAASEKPGGLIPHNHEWSSIHAQAGRFGSARPQRNSTDEIVAAAMRGLEQYNAGRAFR